MTKATRICLLVISLATLIKCLLIHVGVIDCGFGDGSTRIIMANRMALTEGSYVNHNFWTAVWPYGPFIIQGSVIRFLNLIGVADQFHLVKVCLTLTSLLFGASLIFIYSAVSALTNRVSGNLVVFGMLGCEIINLFSVSANAETYALFFGSIGFWIMVKISDRPLSSISAASFFLLAQLCRTEFAIVTLLVTCTLIIHRKWQQGLILFGIGNSFLYLRVLVAHFLGLSVNSPSTWTSIYGEPDYFFEPLMKVFSAFLSLLNSSDLWVVLWGLVGFLICFRFKQFRPLCYVALGYPSLLVTYHVLFVRTSWSPRYFYFDLIMFILMGGIGLGKLYQSWNDSRFPLKRAILGTLSVGVVLLSTLGFYRVHSNQSKVPFAKYVRIPSGVKEASQWINARLQPEDCISFDSMRGWEQYLHAHTSSMSFLRGSWDYANSIIPDRPIDYGDEEPSKGVQVTANSHAHIASNHPRYIVLSGPRLAYPKGHKSYGKHRRNSYVREYCKKLKNERNSFVFITPYIDHLPVLFREVYANEYIIVFRALYYNSHTFPGSQFEYE